MADEEEMEALEEEEEEVAVEKESNWACAGSSLGGPGPLGTTLKYKTNSLCHLGLGTGTG